MSRRSSSSVDTSYVYPVGRSRQLRPWADDEGGVPAYRAGVGLRRGRRSVLTALGVALFQVVGSFGAADNQPERRALDALASCSAPRRPAALAVRDRWPLVAVAVSVGAADVYIGLGYPYGPIFVSVVVALFSAVQAGQRRSTWALAAAGYAGFVVASLLDPRADQSERGALALGRRLARRGAGRVGGGPGPPGAGGRAGSGPSARSGAAPSASSGCAWPRSSTTCSPTTSR